MNASEFTTHITALPAVTVSENFGYRFFFSATDQMTPFVTLAGSDNEYDSVSDLNREGIFRLNIGVARDTFKAIFPGSGTRWDYTRLNQFMPHPQYAAQHFICVLNPQGGVLGRTLELIAEAHGIARKRFKRKKPKEQQ